VTPQPPRDGHAASPVDREFLQRVRRREPAALERFFDLYYDRVFGHVARMLGDQHRAEDVTHDIFLRLHRHLERLDPDRDPTGWIFTVATNGVRDHWRSRGHKETQRQAELSDEILEVVSGDQENPDAHLDREDDCRVVQLALAELSEPDREVILLRDYEELDTAVIAEMLEARPDAVRQRHSRAVQRLGKAFRRLLGQDRKET